MKKNLNKWILLANKLNPFKWRDTMQQPGLANERKDKN